jgi:hypothetical protein
MPPLDQWTDITLKRALNILEAITTISTHNYKGPAIESVRGEIRDLLKARRERVIRNRKLGLHGD